ncbi:hypothetical protein ACSHWO_35235 (plasmid) [Streptomyces sp. HUAS TT3]|uniref:hypothetical protein n=1 Tax=Streptomyces sp. HUAS TT3 TaxID=3447510 RepID=UPI003F658487
MTRVRGVRRGSGSVRAGLPMYDELATLLRATLPEFLGGLGAALAVTVAKNLDRHWRARRDRRRTQHPDE